MGDLRQRGQSEEERWPRANLLSKAQEAHLHFYSVRLAWGSITQRLATPKSTGSLRHSSGGVRRAWRPGVKVKSQPRLQGVHFLSQTRVPAEGCPRDQGTKAWPDSPPPARPWWPWGGGTRRRPPPGRQGLSCSQAGLPSSSREFTKDLRARTWHRDAEFKCDSFEVVRGQPDTALLGTESALNFLFFFWWLHRASKWAIPGYAAKGAPRWISSPRGTEPAPGE